MKKLVFFVFLFAFAFGLECTAQYSAKKVVYYGTVRDDGYYKITKGAFWATRPEAKTIFNGGEVPGFTKYVLDAPAFVRFIDEEHNQSDKNYIIFPAGEIVYSNNTTGKFYSAKCGNEIEYLGKVGTIEIQTEKTSIIEETKQSSTSSVGGGKVLDYGGGDVVNTPVNPTATGTAKTEIIRTRTWLGRKWPWFAATAAGIGLGFIAHDSNHNWYLWFPKSSPHGTMSDGRAFTTNTGTGTQDGGRGD